MSATLVLAFLGIAALAYVTPGPDWFVVMRHAAVDPRSGYAAALGVQSGLIVHMTAAAVGVATLLLASAEVFAVFKLLGAGYLVFLGVQSIIRASRSARGAADAGREPTQRPGLGTVYRQSLMANVLNPKAALFFVAVLPQFLTSGAPIAPQVLVLGALDIGLGLMWWFAFVRGINGVQGLLGRQRACLVIDRVAGVALIGLGGALSLTDRPRVAT